MKINKRGSGLGSRKPSLKESAQPVQPQPDPPLSEGAYMLKIQKYKKMKSELNNATK